MTRATVVAVCIVTAVVAGLAFRFADWSIYGTEQFASVTTTSSTTTTQPIIVVTPLPPDTTTNVPVSTQARQRNVLTSTTVPDGLRCPEWWPVLQAFWPEHLLRQADYVVWSETRCQNVHRSDVGVIGYGDHGIFQVNGINLDYLAGWGITAEDLMNPAQNAVAALILFQWAENKYGCGWQPWYNSVNPWQLCNGETT